ncbi:MAG: sugar phosphate isomerase/epimerase family protein [Enterobacteriaceae bacterium]
MQSLQHHFSALLATNLPAEEKKKIPQLTPELARHLLSRLDQVRLFAHAYTHLMNFTHGQFRPVDMIDFAWRHELDGLAIHLLDGEERSLSQMSDDQLRDVAAHASKRGIPLHLEISSTLKADVDQVVHIARVMGVQHIRVYSRYEGTLSQVMDIIRQDLRYLIELAERYDLYFYFEQHEELNSDEIATLLGEANHPRLSMLFDFGNMINACEQPMMALRRLAPFIRQVHMKGVRILPQEGGFGHYGVLQGSPEDDLPGARMLFELLMLGEQQPQVIAFILEQENHYYAPMFRSQNEADDPFIPYRTMSETGLPEGFTMARMLDEEPQWAINQIRYVRHLLVQLRTLAQCALSSDVVQERR